MTPILFNLDRFSDQPLLDPWWFLGLATVLPIAVLGGWYQWQRRRGMPEVREALQQRDIVSETEEVEVGQDTDFADKRRLDSPL